MSKAASNPPVAGPNGMNFHLRTRSEAALLRAGRFDELHLGSSIDAVPPPKVAQALARDDLPEPPDLPDQS